MLVDERLDMLWQCVLTAMKASHILGYIQRSMDSRVREEILSFYFSSVRPCLEYCVQLWGLQYKKVMELLKSVQRKATRMISGLEHFFYEEVGVIQLGEVKPPARTYCDLLVLQ